MARRKANSRIRPINEIRTTRRAGTAWDREFLGDNRYNPPEHTQAVPAPNSRTAFNDMTATQIQAQQRTDLRTRQEIEMTLNGDDSLLLPYQPTPTINPGRPRTLAAGYDERSQTLRIRFRDGDYYTYFNIPPSVWWKFTRTNSPGRFINSTLNGFPYNRGLF